MTPFDEAFDDIIEDLTGSCQSLDDVLNDYGLSWQDLSAEDIQRIDETIFECTNCGWWYSIDEQETSNSTEEPVCRWCFEDEEELDDLEEMED